MLLRGDTPLALHVQAVLADGFLRLLEEYQFKRRLIRSLVTRKPDAG
jgi:hypothetical protein